MTAKQNKIIKKYINLFALQEWDINVSISDDVDQGQDANCYFCTDSMTAMIFISPHAEFEICIIHELIHLILAIQSKFIDDLVNEYVPQNNREFINSQLSQLNEHIVIKLERSINKLKEGE